MFFPRGIFLSALAAVVPFCGYAAEVKGLSIEEALDIAYHDNLQMVEARSSMDAAKGDLITARGLANPDVELEIGGLTKNEDGKRRLNLDGIAVKQGFDPPGVYLLRRQLALNRIKIGEEAVRSVWLDVYTQVLQAYWKIILDKKDVELAEENLRTMRQVYANVQIRFQSGQALKNDVQRAKIELLGTENSYLLAHNTLKIDHGRLNLLLNRPMAVPFEITDGLQEEDLTFNLRQLTDLALSKRPDLKMEQLLLNAKDKAVLKEELSRLPSFSVGLAKGGKEYDKDYSILASITVPLWNLNQGEVKKAKAERDAQRIRLDAARNQVSFDVYEAYLNAVLAQQQITLLRKSLEEANELIRLADLRYREGEIDFINYMDQIRASLETRVKYYQGLFDLNRSVSALERAVNTSLQRGGFLK